MTKCPPLHLHSLFRCRPSNRSHCPAGNITVAALNVKNIKTNKVYIEQILKSIDILCIQEHWPFSFELGLLNSGSPTHRCHNKAVDDNDPVSPAGPPHGYGGVGIFYRSNWSLNVIELPDGGNRVCVIEVQAENPILVICTYLPSRKYLKKDSSSGDPTEFMSTLDQLQEIIQAYENTNTILLCGDIISSLLKRHGNPQDQMLHDFVLQLELSSHQGGTPTFFHGNGRDNSEVDYLLTKCEQNMILKPTTVAENSSSNLFDHTMLSGDIKWTLNLKEHKR